MIIILYLQKEKVDYYSMSLCGVNLKHFMLPALTGTIYAIWISATD